MLSQSACLQDACRGNRGRLEGGGRTKHTTFARMSIGTACSKPIWMPTFLSPAFKGLFMAGHSVQLPLGACEICTGLLQHQPAVRIDCHGAKLSHILSPSSCIGVVVCGVGVAIIRKSAIAPPPPSEQLLCCGAKEHQQQQ